MPQPSAFERFAPAILKVYRQDREAFWTAVMALFLAGPSLMSAWRSRHVGLGLLSAFRQLDSEARRILKEYSAPLDFDVTGWKSLQAKAEYFKDAYPIFAFLVIWMEEEGLSEPLERFGDILRSAAFGIAGYGILDVNMDAQSSSPVEILTAQALVSEYERLLLGAFGVTPVNLEILHRVRSLFLQAEIREKRLRGRASPYRLERPVECGYKAAHLLTPFMLGLERLGRSAHIDDYFEVFFLFGAVIQILDDWKDLEDDLSIGHYSYVTLGHESLLASKKPAEIARLLRADSRHVSANYAVCKDLIGRSMAILSRLEDPFLARVVTVTDLRLESFFRKDLKMQPA